MQCSEVHEQPGGRAGWSAVDVSGVIRFWDYLAQQCIYTIDEHRPSRQTLGIAINCTRDHIVSFGADHMLLIYDVKTKARITHLTHTYVRLCRAAPALPATACTHTHTHPFIGPFSGTTQVSRYQKGETNLDFTEARDSEWQWHQLGHMQVCISLQTDNHASTPTTQVFYRPDALPAAQPTALKH